MPIVAAYRNQIITSNDPALMGEVEISLSPGKDTKAYTYSVNLVRVQIPDGYQVDWSQDGKKRLFRVGEEHGTGIDLKTALNDGMATVIEP